MAWVGGGYVPMVTETPKVYPIEGNGTRDSHQGRGWSEEETMYTLNTVEQHCVAQPMSTTGGQNEAFAIGNGQMNQVQMQDKVGTLNCMHDQIAILQVTDKTSLEASAPMTLSTTDKT